jgi:hypothetical protein
MRRSASTSRSVFRSVSFVVFALFGSPAVAEPPIIDMHVHAKNAVQDGPQHPMNIASMHEYEAEADANNVILFAASGAHRFVDSWSEHFGERMLPGATFPCINGETNFEGESDGRQACFPNDGILPNIDWLRSQLERGHFQIMGELGMQYVGVSFDDERLTPYYEMAETLDIPIAFHTSGGPPRTAERCCSDFRLSIGDPAQLEEVLVRYPKLRVQVMHANVLTYPGLLRLLQQFPNVYVDLTPFSSILPEEGFHQMLRTYRMHGLLNRIMFATDDFPVAATLLAYRKAEFLTADELRGIECGNAQQFLRLENVCATGN